MNIKCLKTKRCPIKNRDLKNNENIKQRYKHVHRFPMQNKKTQICRITKSWFEFINRFAQYALNLLIPSILQDYLPILCLQKSLILESFAAIRKEYEIKL